LKNLFDARVFIRRQWRDMPPQAIDAARIGPSQAALMPQERHRRRRAFMQTDIAFHRVYFRRRTTRV